jgi:hypothetical protein
LQDGKEQQKSKTGYVFAGIAFSAELTRSICYFRLWGVDSYRSNMTINILPNMTNEEVLAQLSPTQMTQGTTLGLAVQSGVLQALSSGSEFQKFLVNPHSYLTASGASIPAEEAVYNESFSSAYSAVFGANPPKPVPPHLPGEISFIPMVQGTWTPGPSSPVSCPVCKLIVMAVVVCFVIATVVITLIILPLLLAALSVLATVVLATLSGLILGVTAYEVATIFCELTGSCP